jgi:hypothetical protein
MSKYSTSMGSYQQMVLGRDIAASQTTSQPVIIQTLGLLSKSLVDSQDEQMKTLVKARLQTVDMLLDYHAEQQSFVAEIRESRGKDRRAAMNAAARAYAAKTAADARLETARASVGRQYTEAARAGMETGGKVGAINALFGKIGESTEMDGITETALPEVMSDIMSVLGGKFDSNMSVSDMMKPLYEEGKFDKTSTQWSRLENYLSAAKEADRSWKETGARIDSDRKALKGLLDAYKTGGVTDEAQLDAMVDDALNKVESINGAMDDRYDTRDMDTINRERAALEGQNRATRQTELLIEQLSGMLGQEDAWSTRMKKALKDPALQEWADDRGFRLGYLTYDEEGNEIYVESKQDKRAMRALLRETRTGKVSGAATRSKEAGFVTYTVPDEATAERFRFKDGSFAFRVVGGEPTYITESHYDATVGKKVKPTLFIYGSGPLGEVQSEDAPLIMGDPTGRLIEERNVKGETTGWYMWSNRGGFLEVPQENWDVELKHADLEDEEDRPQTIAGQFKTIAQETSDWSLLPQPMATRDVNGLVTGYAVATDLIPADTEADDDGYRTNPDAAMPTDKDGRPVSLATLQKLREAEPANPALTDAVLFNAATPETMATLQSRVAQEQGIQVTDQAPTSKVIEYGVRRRVPWSRRQQRGAGYFELQGMDGISEIPAEANPTWVITEELNFAKHGLALSGVFLGHIGTQTKVDAFIVKTSDMDPRDAKIQSDARGTLTSFDATGEVEAGYDTDPVAKKRLAGEPKQRELKRLKRQMKNRGIDDASLTSSLTKLHKSRAELSAQIEEKKARQKEAGTSAEGQKIQAEIDELEAQLSSNNGLMSRTRDLVTMLHSEDPETQVDIINRGRAGAGIDGGPVESDPDYIAAFAAAPVPESPVVEPPPREKAPPFPEDFPEPTTPEEWRKAVETVDLKNEDAVKSLMLSDLSADDREILEDRLAATFPAATGYPEAKPSTEETKPEEAQLYVEGTWGYKKLPDGNIQSYKNEGTTENPEWKESNILKKSEPDKGWKTASEIITKQETAQAKDAEDVKKAQAKQKAEQEAEAKTKKRQKQIDAYETAKTKVEKAKQQFISGKDEQGSNLKKSKTRDDLKAAIEALKDAGTQLPEDVKADPLPTMKEIRREKRKEPEQVSSVLKQPPGPLRGQQARKLRGLEEKKEGAVAAGPSSRFRDIFKQASGAADAQPQPKPESLVALAERVPVQSPTPDLLGDATPSMAGLSPREAKLQEDSIKREQELTYG